MNNSSRHHDDNDNDDVKINNDCNHVHTTTDCNRNLVSKLPLLLSPAKRRKLPSESVMLATTTTRTTETTTTTCTSSSVYGSLSSESDALMASIMMRISNNNNDTTAAPAAPATAASFTLLHADFCPYANRVWVALLEKQEQQHNTSTNTNTNTKLFSEILCCYFAGPVKDEGTKLLYSLGFKTVPAVIYNNSTAGGGDKSESEPSFQALGQSSSLLAEYVDDTFSSSYSSNNDDKYDVGFSSLKPLSNDPIMLFNMRYFIQKYDSYCDYYYTYLMNQDPLQEKEIAQQFQSYLQEIENDLTIFSSRKGPYLCGNLFTLADIHIFGFIERTIIVIQHYKKYGRTNNKESSSSSRLWKITVDSNNKEEKGKEEIIVADDDDNNDFKNISRWYKTMVERPSIKNFIIVERRNQSKDIMIFEALERKEYLIEVYECYANNEVQLAKTIHAKHSRPGYNAYKKYRNENEKRGGGDIRIK
ncbi:hypothetical protein FRACYDRAFT_263339 [Fragilariopsis cylindrus CCMP1102]|uniref:GST C-terminal domain-containing protein n=1 Tax=Fragilariopsis cylindrus CCMP1102 TaxID=635003 RepID=A0A1E7F1E7_9STRA|nr:hypothetical protein FRACYDRAFT_263339 [Fragilariopsis cylindrus CCMP1102]|eukprot:OEU11895.1 hypothetical protein FRACYDRAFT_263339 [Fragilariopsis cylindrus CCMP1102]